MNPMRLIIRQDGKETAQLQSSPCCTPDQLRQLARHLLTLSGCELELQQSCGERRILDSGPTGLRVLCAEVLYEKNDLNSWLQADAQALTV